MELSYPFIRMSCIACYKCWCNVETGGCIHGGPFDGYKDEDDYIVKLPPLPGKE